MRCGRGRRGAVGVALERRADWIGAQRQLAQLEELLERSEGARSGQQLPNSGPLLPRSTLEAKPSLTKQYAVFWASAGACALRLRLRARGLTRA
jgi:hypothetical protein